MASDSSRFTLCQLNKYSSKIKNVEYFVNLNKFLTLESGPTNQQMLQIWHMTQNSDDSFPDPDSKGLTSHTVKVGLWMNLVHDFQIPNVTPKLACQSPDTNPNFPHKPLILDIVMAAKLRFNLEGFSHEWVSP